MCVFCFTMEKEGWVLFGSYQKWPRQDMETHPLSKHWLLCFISSSRIRAFGVYFFLPQMGYYIFQNSSFIIGFFSSRSRFVLLRLWHWAFMGRWKTLWLVLPIYSYKTGKTSWMEISGMWMRIRMKEIVILLVDLVDPHFFFYLV